MAFWASSQLANRAANLTNPAVLFGLVAQIAIALQIATVKFEIARFIYLKFSHQESKDDIIKRQK